MDNFLASAGGFGCFAAFLAPVIFLWIWHFRRSNSLLEQWAAKGGYRILSREHRALRKGPFLWNSTRGQAVYYVVVVDSDGDTRSGWVRCGGYWLGMLSDHTEVRWDD
jgi:hypothetical protein